MVRISGYGQTGPYRDKPGFAAIAEAVGGLRHLTGDPDRAPVRAGVSLGDTLAGSYAVIGALIGAAPSQGQRRQGQFVDVALYEAVFGVMESLIPEFSRSGFVRERTGGSLPGIAPSNTYPCNDGSYVVIARQQRRHLQAPDARDRPARPGGRSRARGQRRARAANGRIDAAISDWTSQHTARRGAVALETADVPGAKIYTAADIHARSPLPRRGMIEPAAMPDGVAVDLPGIVPSLSETPGRTAWIGPALGAHAGEVLGRLGLDGAAVEDLRKEGVI